MFLNYYFDILAVEDLLTTPVQINFYNAQVSMAKVICLANGGCMLITSTVMLLFYIKHYIDTHRKELGILKALGYSNIKIARYFSTFGLSIFVGTSIGYLGAFIIMPTFYDLQNEDKILPNLEISFHFSILLYFIILPTIVFALIAVFYAYLKLKKPVLLLLKDSSFVPHKIKKIKNTSGKEKSFIAELQKNTLIQKKALVFFIIFSAFCFSAMTQMSFSVREVASDLMGTIMLTLGLILSFTTLFLAVTTVIRGNIQTIAIMKAFGYSQKECARAILGGYRIPSYIGFAIGTLYQHIMFKFVVSMVFKDVDIGFVYEFDEGIMLISLATFIVVYESVMYLYSEKLKKISLKEIMLA
jgi:hypothetical protein